MSDHIKIASRYAVALFEVAKEAKATEILEKELIALQNLISEASDFRLFLTNPSFSREEQMAAVDDIGKKVKLSSMVVNTIKLVAENRRLSLLENIILLTLEKLTEDRGEVTAKILSAKKLSSKQEKDIVTALKKATGKDVSVETAIDSELIGGVIVRCGSLMIDNSVKTKIETMKRQMKGAA